MKVIGEIKQISERRESKNGSFYWRELFIQGTIDSQSQDGFYKFTVKKEDSDNLYAQFRVGDVIEANFWVNGREWQGKSITDLTAYSIRSASSRSASSPSPSSQAAPQQEEPKDRISSVTGDDDLPF